MSNYREHVCGQTDEMGDAVEPDATRCGLCDRAWCERCDPTPGPLCPWCHGRGYSTAPIPPRQLRALWGALA